MKILVFGASGMLGLKLVPYLAGQGHEVLEASRHPSAGIQINLQDQASVLAALRTASPDVVVNLVGMTDVDRCESYPKEAWQANVQTAEIISSACTIMGTHLVHLSTDQVYDSLPASTESDACPGNHYAMTKYAGESAALRAGATVLRTNFFGRSSHATRRSLTDWIFSALKDERSVQVFDDVHFSPLDMGTVCSMIHRIIQSNRCSGVFNLGSHGGMSKAVFAFAFAQAIGYSGTCFTRVRMEESGLLKAWRPKNMCMDSTHFETTFEVSLPSLQTEIERTAKEYRDHI